MWSNKDSVSQKTLGKTILHTLLLEKNTLQIEQSMVNRVNAGSLITLGELKKLLTKEDLSGLDDLKESILSVIAGYLFEGLIIEELFKEYVYFLEVLFHESKLLLEEEGFDKEMDVVEEF